MSTPLPIARFFGQSALYAAGSALVRAGNFILLPVYWHYLTPADFGILAITELVSIGLLSVLTLCLEGSLTRFYFEWPAKERPRQLGSLWIASLIGSVALALLAYGALWLLWDPVIRQVPFAPYVQLAIAAAAARSFSTIPFSLLRMQENLAALNLAGVAVFVFTSGISLYLVIGRDLGIQGVLIGGAAGHAIVAIFWIAFMARQVVFRLDRKILAPYLSYSLPLVPAVAAAWLASLCDRFFLDRFVPLGQIGLYSTAGRFSGLVKEGHQALKNAWIPTANQLLLKREDGARVVSRLATYYLGAVIFGGLAVALLAREFLLVFDRGAFQGAAIFIPILVLAALAGPFEVLAGLRLAMAKKSGTLLGLTLVECVVSLALIGILTWQWGPMGAAWGVAGSAAAAALLRSWVSAKAYPLSFEYGKLAALVAIAGVVYGVSLIVELESVALSALVKGALLAAYGAACWRLVLRKKTR